MPVGSLAAGLVQVTGKATVVAVLSGTFTDEVTCGATKEAGQQLLHTQTHLHSESFHPLVLISVYKLNMPLCTERN